MNCPTWRPSATMVASNSWSGSRKVALKNSRIAIASLPTNTGKANEDLRPACAAMVLRWKFSSSLRSGIQAGSEVENTFPGRPSPASNSFFLDSAMNVPRASLAAEICVHISTGRLVVYCQKAPTSHPRLMQMEAIIVGRTDDKSSAEASTFDTAK